MDARAVMAAMAHQNLYGLASAGLPDPACLLSPTDQLYATIHPQTQPAATATGIPVAPPDVLTEELGKLAEEDVHETVSKEVFSSYQHRKILPGCQPHPGDIVEAGMLASLTMPTPSYPLAMSLPLDMITSGKLSSLQLEGILYACQRHQMILPNERRAGFFIGDAAGVGKGRQIAGIVFDNFARGRKRHIWFSISTDLVVDARRDLSDIGCFIKVIEGCQQLDKETRVFGLPSDFKEGVIFSTYATLVSSVQRGKTINSTRQTRLQQLVDWCGGDNYEGCLIFDECHKAKNFVPGKDSVSTKVALAVTHIQKLLPRARVLYCSATGVTDVKNMAFMERMGLWGEGAPFKGFDEFIKTVEKKGLGVAEMLAMEMKSSGLYLSRGLSYREAEFCTHEIELTKEQIKMYDMSAHVWNELRTSLEHAVSRTNCSNNRIWTSYWAAHQRFFKQLCLGIKVPAVVREAKAALDRGHCVVIGLQTTGEASMESEATSKKGSLKGFVSLCREILMRFLDLHFPITIEGQLGEGESPIDDWSVTAKQMLVAFTKQIPLPDSTLDDIIDKLGGPDNVSEMTGRHARIVRRGGVPQYELRDANDSTGFKESLNVKERNLFMDGPKRVAIISDAASTGISLHADRRMSNQCRRVHMTIELPWSADKAVQQLGRSHRSNQSTGLMYMLMTTSLGGERRFAATVARRLQSLGALTKGDRRAATGADLAEFNFDTPYGRMALRNMYTAICHQELVTGVAFDTVSQDRFSAFTEFNDEILECLNLMCILEMDVLRNLPKVKDSISSDVGRFLNRILGLSVARQQLVFNYFIKCLDAQIESAKKEGKYNEGLIDLQASSVEMLGEPRLVFKEASNGHNPTKHVTLSVDRGMSWEAAISRLESHQGEDNGFYKSRRDMFGRTMFVLATQKEGSTHSFTLARPNTGVSNFDEDRADLLNKYVMVPKEDAESAWKEYHEGSKDRCIHGPHCKTGATCTVGSRCYTVHLLCGGIVTMMSLLETTIARYGSRLSLTKAESTLRVVRAELNSGMRVVGIRYPEALIPLVEQMLQEQKMIEQAQQNQAVLTAAALGLTVTAPKVVKRQVEIESVTEVNPKCLKKAMTPPVTIKNFFKAVSKPEPPPPQDEARQSVTSKASEKPTIKKSEVGKTAIAKAFEKSKPAEKSTTQTSDSPKPSTGRKLKRGKLEKRLCKKNYDEDWEDEGSSSTSKPREAKGWSEDSQSDEENVWEVDSADEYELPKRRTRASQGGITKCTPSRKRSGTPSNDDQKGNASKKAKTSTSSQEGEVTKKHSDVADVKHSLVAMTSDSNANEDKSLQSENLKNSAPKLGETQLTKSTKKKSKPATAKRGKPPKQRSIFSAFANADRNKTKECPICRKQFKATDLNSEINTHIDNCLIE